ncbi:MAG: maleylpyruvate isomerase family mycothiol-dependent enzyme [Acidimicrobiia bacterium]|nr:maleylpyruvate isomerase family mycothiol-dependent enzyme [Acidimicrobiia bacterium]
MAEQSRTLENLRKVWLSVDALFTGLSDDEWHSQSLCPDFDARGILDHLAGVEYVLWGWRPNGLENPPPFEKMGEFAAETKDLTGPQLLDRTEALMHDRLREMEAMRPDEFGGPSITPAGPATYDRFMEIRVFDFWVHERDLRTPLDRPTDDGGPEAEMALAEVHRSLGYIVGKKIGLPDGMSIRFDLHGGLDTSLSAAVDGRAAVVDRLDEPDVVVSADFVTFMQLACGRIDPEAQIEAGHISWSGNDEWGAKTARNLAYTM